jgi:hypothetical protein
MGPFLNPSWPQGQPLSTCSEEERPRGPGHPPWLEGLLLGTWSQPCRTCQPQKQERHFSLPPPTHGLVLALKVTRERRGGLRTLHEKKEKPRDVAPSDTAGLGGGVAGLLVFATQQDPNQWEIETCTEGGKQGGWRSCTLGAEGSAISTWGNGLFTHSYGTFATGPGWVRRFGGESDAVLELGRGGTTGGNT